MEQKIVVLPITDLYKRREEILLSSKESDFGWKLASYQVLPRFDGDKDLIYVVACFEREISTPV